MSFLDVAVAGAMVALSGLWAFRFSLAGLSLRIVVLGLIALALLQVALEGFYWQFIPGYILVAVASLLRNTGMTSIRLRLFLAALFLPFVAVWVLVPVPRLTQPQGRYAIGTKVFRWVDASRPEEATADPGDRRNVVVQAWYPAAEASRGLSSPYIDGLGRLPDYVSLLPGFVMSRYDRIQSNGILDAPISTDRSRWPVVVFSPGYGASRAFYTSLVSGLASRGYVVLAVDHPYEAALVELADGRIVTTVENFSKDDGDRIGYMIRHLDLRASDVSCVLDQIQRVDVLGEVLFHRLDLDHIGVIGHSFGGATAAVAMDRDPRVKAAANIDGTLYGSIAGKALKGQFLLLQSDPAETHHSEWYLSGNRQLLENLEAGGFRYEIGGANHYGFTDVPLFFSAPGRFLLAQLIGGPRDVEETHRATVEIVAAFLQGPLTGQPGSIENVVRRYEGIVGGPVGPHSKKARSAGAGG